MLPATTTPLQGAKDVHAHPAWLMAKQEAGALRTLQDADGSISDPLHYTKAKQHITALREAVTELADLLPHETSYLTALSEDLKSWADAGFTTPDFFASLDAFHPDQHRVDGTPLVVIFPMYTQNGSTERLMEAVLCEVVWPEFVARVEEEKHSNPLFVPIRFVDFTPGYDTHSAVLFPESVAVTPREIPGAAPGTPPALPVFTWGAIFADREAARFRHVVSTAVDITKLDLPDDAARLLVDQDFAEKTFVLWDLIHDRTHMRGDLPFDPFMIKQRMPYFLYGLEELRCDLTAFRECVSLIADNSVDSVTREHAKAVLYAVVFDRIFRFPLSGTRVRNYDGLAGQLLFAWLHQRGVLHWTDTQLAIDWDTMPAEVVALSDAINTLYWKSIDRPKVVHWLAAYDLVSDTLSPHPGSVWATKDLPFHSSPKELTDAVLDDEFPLSMFYEALARKMGNTIEQTRGITGTSVEA
jgi:hypothetical protein